jgi:hypothetical protein
VVDESETGSANFFGPTQCLPSSPGAAVHFLPVHLRPPSIDPGILSFVWALLLALFIWGGLLAIGISQGTALVLALLAFGAMFLFIRLQGGNDPVR